MFPDFFKPGAVVYSIYHIHYWTLDSYDDKKNRWVGIDSEGKIAHITETESMHYKEKK